MSSPIPVSDVLETVPYPTELAAAQAALSIAASRSSANEYGGLIWELAGAFYYSDPVTLGDGYEFAARSGKRPDGATFSALYHTHPSLDDSAKMFSPNDVATATALKVNSYIYVFADQKIRLFIPGRTATFDYASDDPFSQTRASEGVFV